VHGAETTICPLKAIKIPEGFRLHKNLQESNMFGVMRVSYLTIWRDYPSRAFGDVKPKKVHFYSTLQYLTAFYT
jgi:hypothetical protein